MCVKDDIIYYIENKYSNIKINWFMTASGLSKPLPSAPSYIHNQFGFPFAALTPSQA